MSRTGRFSIPWTRFVLDVIPLSVAEMDYNVATSIPDVIVETLTAVAVLVAR